MVAAVVTAAQAQSPAPPPDLEPGVQTSSAATLAPGAASPSPAAPTGKTAARTARGAPQAPAAPKGPAPQDRIELDTTQISGNRELPKVMYVVPWRRADLGDVAGRPPNSLLDEALTPVDRDVFRRQNRYYAALEAGADAPRSQPGAAAAGAGAPVIKDEK
jgi:hypothetical protein